MVSKSAYFLVFVLFSFVSNAQDSKKEMLSIFSTDQKLIRLSVDSSICIIRQEYTLVDSAGNEYGVDNLPYWGIGYFVGVITDNGIYTSREVIEPWKDDAELKAFMKTDDKKRQPHLSKNLVKRPQDLKFVKSKQVAGYTVVSDSTFVLLENVNSFPGIKCIADATENYSWLVTIESQKDETQEKNFKFISNAIKPSTSPVKGRKDVLHINNNLDSTIIGGVYFSMRISLGKIVFEATGLMKKDRESGWLIIPFNSNTLPKKVTPITQANTDNIPQQIKAATAINAKPDTKTKTKEKRKKKKEGDNKKS